jgi:predicted DNA-binding mobile mystery protein A
MTVKSIAQAHMRKVIDRAQKASGSFNIIEKSWLRLVRKSLGMSGAELARTLHVTRALVAQAERNEEQGNVTIKTLKTLATAMGCKLVYAIVPENNETIEDLIKKQALKKARAIAARTHEHMAFENQSLSRDSLDFQIQQLAERLRIQMPSDFWSED